MKSIFFSFLFIVTISNNFLSQLEMDYGLYYFVNPKLESKVYNNLLIFSNCDIPTIIEMKNVVKKEGFNVYTQNDLFPPYKNWNEEEVDSMIKLKKIDGILHLNYLSISTVTPHIKIGKYLPPTEFIPSKMITHTPSKTETEVEGFFVDVNNLNEYTFYCTGLVKGRPMPTCYKSLNKLTQKIKELNIAFTNQEDFDKFNKGVGLIPELKNYIFKADCILMIDINDKPLEVIILEATSSKILFRTCDNNIHREKFKSDIKFFKTLDGTLIYDFKNH